ncbi:hypothetical protein [Komagataeibacter europaeus]|uniref:hypothetical protein n=1 Tax=Komagataeibacter europaeus TaxID=33995 RepID=UPI0015F7A3C3|nr:hypothetical protein [Komagataeibacter europaeus]
MLADAIVNDHLIALLAIVPVLLTCLYRHGRQDEGNLQLQECEPEHPLSVSLHK